MLTLLGKRTELEPNVYAWRRSGQNHVPYNDKVGKFLTTRCISYK